MIPPESRVYLRRALHRSSLARLLINPERSQRALEVGVFRPSDQPQKLAPGDAVLERTRSPAKLGARPLMRGGPRSCRGTSGPG